MRKINKTALAAGLLTVLIILFCAFTACGDEQEDAAVTSLEALAAQPEPEPETETATEPEPEPEPETEPEETAGAAEDVPEEPEAPPAATEPPPTAPPAATPQTTELQTAELQAAEPPPVHIEAPKADFIQSMFERAIPIPGSFYKVEPPPEGRSVELQYGVVPLAENIPEPFSYFKNIVLLGDSVTEEFAIYKNHIKFNGEAVLRDLSVIAIRGYGAYNATRELSANSHHPFFEGNQMRPEDIIARTDAENVFICLGMNDIVWQEIHNFVIYYSDLINNIKAKNPEKNIVIMSLTPVAAGYTETKLNTQSVTAANNALLKFAIENNIPFVDYGAAIRDSQNNLYEEFSFDGTHVTIPALNRLVEYMLYHPALPPDRTPPVITLVINGAVISPDSVAEVREEQNITISASHSSGISEIQYISGAEDAKKFAGDSTALWYNGTGTVELKVSAAAVNGTVSDFVTYTLKVTPKPPPVYIEAPKDDFIRVMFERAVDIPDSEYKIEPPPAGRSIELQHGIVPLSETIPEPHAYFDDIIILGDSVTLGFDVFKSRIKFNGEPVLGGMTVVSSGSYGVYNSSKQITSGTVHPRVGGVQRYPEDIIAELAAKNVLICLGLNDSWLGVGGYIEHYSALIKRIQEKSPDKNIVIMSVTPVTKGQTKLSSSKLSDMNNALIEFAVNNGYMFIDFGAAIRDGENFLFASLSSDNYCHLTLSAYNRLVEYMLYHPIKPKQPEPPEQEEQPEQTEQEEQTEYIEQEE